LSAPADRAVLAQGVDNSKTNPILHGEIVAINDYVAQREILLDQPGRTQLLQSLAA
jgi:hypothetical protein